jgi:23S rRNA (cytosine1962-C5)-methyltransferase
MVEAILRLKPNARARVRSGHPWVFSNEVAELLPGTLDGAAVECRDARGRFLGMGIYNSRSQIVWRRYSRERVDFGPVFLRSALVTAIARRRPAAARRLVWSEADDLPGLVVDQYGEALVVQTQTLAMERQLPAIVAALQATLAAAEIVIRNDAPVRRLEGLPLEVRTVSGQPWQPHWFPIDGVEYWLDLAGGQKTGFYLDQAHEHRRVAAHAGGRRVLDAFCNQGPFALHAAKGGATEVLGIDSAEDAIALARRNAERNGVADKVRFEVANVFDLLAARDDRSWDLIVLDPPPFARSHRALEGALRGYKEINLRAMKRLSPGGILATYSCSHHVSAEVFAEVLGEAAGDARRRVQVLEFCHQPPDHPVLLGMPESEYLRGYVLLVE